MSALFGALVAGPLAGLVLEAVGLAGTGKKVVTAGRAVSRLLKVIERVKPKLTPEELAEAEAAMSDAARFDWKN